MDFIERATAIHGDNYGYSNSVYKSKLDFIIFFIDSILKKFIFISKSRDMTDVQH